MNHRIGTVTGIGHDQCDGLGTGCSISMRRVLGRREIIASRRRISEIPGPCHDISASVGLGKVGEMHRLRCHTGVGSLGNLEVGNRGSNLLYVYGLAVAATAVGCNGQDHIISCRAESSI